MRLALFLATMSEPFGEAPGFSIAEDMPEKKNVHRGWLFLKRTPGKRKCFLSGRPLMRLHQFKVAPLVPDDSLSRIALLKVFFLVEQYEPFFIQPSNDLFLSDGA